MDCNMKLWKPRNLTFEGKVIIVKTFGLSQLIYTMQVCNIKEGCIKKIEQLIHGFIWLGNRSVKKEESIELRDQFLKKIIVRVG